MMKCETKINCLNCGKQVIVYKADIKRGKAKYCSKKCSDEYEIKIHIIKKVCIGCGSEFECKKYKTKKYCTHICYMKHNHPFKKMAGSNHPLWKGGECRPWRDNSNINRNWKKSVFKRCGRFCKYCGGTKNLQIDHLWSYSLAPKLRYRVNNGQVLCRDCHRKTFTYGTKNLGFLKELISQFNCELSNKIPSPEEIIYIKRQVLKDHPELQTGFAV